MNLFALLARYVGYRIEGTVASSLLALLPAVRRLGVGAAGLVAGLVSFLLALAFLFLSLFLFLIDRPTWSTAGLWTGLVAALCGALFVAIGKEKLNGAFK